MARSSRARTSGVAQATVSAHTPARTGAAAARARAQERADQVHDSRPRRFEPSDVATTAVMTSDATLVANHRDDGRCLDAPQAASAIGEVHTTM